ncbi:hypothetical protein ACFST9_07880 [Hymenobacter monticola]|uniref:Uncharacterized protein n=1 Tax=Hymenobacter monticola TaxID=1705399 RepID=A0ABY4B3Q8_9BACT|nr:hypothetical protein [Hymenobacter monticola]UOE33777.1 hypothetical protein MTP16_21980 [Hymenobacter monticola]
MKMKRFCTFAAAVLIGGGLATLPTAAQTARIAHFSHSGNAAALDAAADNFGRPYPYFLADSVRLLSDTTAVEYGKWNGSESKEKTHLVEFHRRADAYAKHGVVRRYQAQRGLRARIIPFDSTFWSAKEASTTPTKRKQKTKHKKSAFLPTTVPAPPQHPGVALAIAAILVLAGASWLLGERNPKSSYPV